MSLRPTIAAAVIALNEEANLAALLPRLQWVDEVVVVDGGSQDATAEVARRLGARTFVREFDDYARQRNYALRMADSRWVLSIDADERPSSGMPEEILRRIETGRHAAYRVPIRSTILGRRLRFCGTQDDRPVRLFRRGEAQWQGHVHEVLVHRGRAGQLRQGLEHFTIPDAQAFLAKMNKYCSLEVQRRLAAGVPPRWSDRWSRPPLEVFRRLLWKHGALDGPQGWAFCALSGLSEFVLADLHRRRWHANSSAAPPHRTIAATCQSRFTEAANYNNERGLTAD